MQLRYISDLHLFDSYSLDWRPEFKTLDDFADNLIISWNEFTSNDDIVIIVGDIGYNCPKTHEVIRELKGNKVLVIGNHDREWGSALYCSDLFRGIHEYIYNNGIYVQHIPDEIDFNCQYYIHGHHHRYDVPGMQKKLESYVRDTYRLNCSCDLIHYSPKTLQQLIMEKEIILDKYSAKGLI